MSNPVRMPRKARDYPTKKFSFDARIENAEHIIRQKEKGHPIHETVNHALDIVRTQPIPKEKTKPTKKNK